MWHGRELYTPLFRGSTNQVGWLLGTLPTVDQR